MTCDTEFNNLIEIQEIKFCFYNKFLMQAKTKLRIILQQKLNFLIKNDNVFSSVKRFRHVFKVTENKISLSKIFLIFY